MDENKNTSEVSFLPMEVYGFTSQKRKSDDDREAEEIGLFPWPFEGLDSRL